MRLPLAVFVACAANAPAYADGPTLNGQTGLLTVPTAAVLDEGSAALSASRHDPQPATPGTFENYAFTIGFLPRLELGGRMAEAVAEFGPRDLSFQAKAQLWRGAGGAAIAIGGQDIGGEAQNFRSTYVVASMPWRDLTFTAGYGAGPDVFDGALGGIAWRPLPYLALLAEYDAVRVNAGVRLDSAQLLGPVRLQVLAGQHDDDVEFGAGLVFPLGRTRVAARPVAAAPPPALPAPAPAALPSSAPSPTAPAPTPAPAAASVLRDELLSLGFESVRTGVRDRNVLVVLVENRRYNHAAADGIGLALGTSARLAAPGLERVELTVMSYGVPQVTVAAPAQAWREHVAGRGPAPALEIRYVNDIDVAGTVQWDTPPLPLGAPELVIEPVVRMHAATELGVLDYALGTRLRATIPVFDGFLFNMAYQVPVVNTEDFDSGRDFGSLAPRAGFDTALFQYFMKPAPQWGALFTGGQFWVYRLNLRTFALDQAWLSATGRHQLQARLMLLQSDGFGRHDVAVGSYTYVDPAGRYAATLKGGRFFAGDDGARVDFQRYFGDTIAGLFLKVAGQHDQAAGFLLSLPLTPRQDAFPRGVQVKGSRRWVHGLSTTINPVDGRNVLRPLLLFEPTFDLDLRRDFLDAGRLSPAWLQDDVPRMREAYELWGTAPD